MPPPNDPGLVLVQGKSALKLETRMWERGQVEYDSLDAVNQSALKEMLKSPRHFEHYTLSHVDEPTRAMFQGTAAHTAILEPAEFMKSYAMFSGRRAGKVYDAFCEENKGKTVLKDEEYLRAIRMRDAVHRDPLVSRYLKKGHHEVTMCWQDEETGIWCKGRVDFLSNSMPGWIVDLKSARDVTPWGFGAQAGKLNYHFQAAFYCDGYRAITGKSPEYMILAVESGEPHDVVPYVLDEAVLGPGRDAYRNALVRLKECREKNVWPGLADSGPLRLALPKWMAAAEADDLTELGLEE